jgi:hypothetical protein
MEPQQISPQHLQANQIVTSYAPHDPNASIWPHRRSPTPPSTLTSQEKRNRSSLIYQLTRKLLPGFFAFHFLVTGGIILIDILSPKSTISRRFIIGAAITFAIIISLWVVGEVILRCRRRCNRKTDGMGRPISRPVSEIESGVTLTPGSRVRGSGEGD